MDDGTVNGSVEPSAGHVRAGSSADRLNYVFVMNVAGLAGAESFTLAPGHELRRATQEEVTEIKEILGRMPAGPPKMWEHIWECRAQSDGKGGGEAVALPESEWRYFVISFEGNNQTVVGIEQACTISPVELELGFTAITHSFAQGPSTRALLSHAGRIFQLIEQGRWMKLDFIDVSAVEVETITTIVEQLRAHDHSLLDLQRPISQLQALKALDPNEPLRFLGYFAVLESLLTHPPKSGDPYDSITRQVKNKLALLENRDRWHPATDYTPFGSTSSTSPDNVWTKMYSYRSQLAHGGKPTFEKKLDALKDHSTALMLLKETVKAVIRQGLIEPRLLIDLREC